MYFDYTYRLLFIALFDDFNLIQIDDRSLSSRGTDISIKNGGAELVFHMWVKGQLAYNRENMIDWLIDWCAGRTAS